MAIDPRLCAEWHAREEKLSLPFAAHTHTRARSRKNHAFKSVPPAGSVCVRVRTSAGLSVFERRRLF